MTVWRDAFAYVLWTPVFISIGLLLMWSKDHYGKWGKQLILILYGNFLLVMTAFLFILKNNFAVVRANPFDTQLTDWVYPCDVAFYVASGTAFVISYCGLWKIRLHATYWTCFILLNILLPSYLVLMQYNRWSEVIVSSLMGIGLTVFFMVLVRLFLPPEHVTIMVQQWPWTWSLSIDSYMRTDEEIDSLTPKLKI